MPAFVRNIAWYVIVFAATVAAWFYLASYWSQAVLLGHTFESQWSLALFWGFDFFMALVAALVLALLVANSRPLLWVIALGLGFTILKVQFSRTWTAPDADWTAYLEVYGRYAVPFIGALVGGLFAGWFRTLRHPAPAPNQRLERP